MFTFQTNSGWNLETEIRCLIIYKTLEEVDFPRGLQSDLCSILAESIGLKFESVKAKVGNYKSEFGITGVSHSSEATKCLAKSFGHMTRIELEALLTGYLLGKSEART
ncbi:hypothetical protein [Vibrio parahaemolyticus]|uniref:hypothetical protein n=1 Tax=Vibrio parahaemolyticus TaxID=670 RepID=UPI0027E4FA7C|nr:hypothetical protein [Vibrio parahaemolyticus]WMN64836.1 hypothetical protein NI388_06600 [Vibrio parahaemolyticus]WMN75474.1 hypothetical protein NI386_14680 [Vibrio parahaemolyticus]